MNTYGTSRLSSRRSIATATTALAATAVAAAVALSSPATANAQGSAGSAEAVPQLFPAPDRLVAAGGSPTGACAGFVTTTLNGDSYPASSSVSWAFGVVGVGPCDLTATLSWHNLDTGAKGEKVAQIPHPRISTGIPDPIAHPYDAFIYTGPGRVEYRLTTNAGAVAGPVVVDTAAYTG